MIYSIKLKEIRTQNQKMQKELAELLDISESCYSRYENELDIIPITHLNILCNYFNISIDYVFELTNNNYKNINSDINNKLSGTRLKELRKEYKLTQDKLAKELNASRSTITGYEIGRYTIATPFLYAICKKYNISADYLLGKIDNPKYLHQK